MSKLVSYTMDKQRPTTATVNSQELHDKFYKQKLSKEVAIFSELYDITYLMRGTQTAHNANAILTMLLTMSCPCAHPPPQNFESMQLMRVMPPNFTSNRHILHSIRPSTVQRLRHGRIAVFLYTVLEVYTHNFENIQTHLIASSYPSLRLVHFKNLNFYVYISIHSRDYY